MQIVYKGVEYSVETLETLNGKDLVALYNEIERRLNKEEPKEVSRFADKKRAVKRVWAQLEKLPKEQPKKIESESLTAMPVKITAPLIAPMPKKKETEKESVTITEKRRKGINLTPFGGAPLPCREGSKQSILVDTLARPQGATMSELLAALSGGKKPWAEVTVRSGLGWDVRNKGYGVRSVVGEDGQERFFLVIPEGYSIPPHYRKK